MVEERFDSAAIEQKAGACEDAGIRLKLSLTLLLLARRRRVRRRNDGPPRSASTT